MQYLDKLGLLGTDVVAAHRIFADDRKILAQRHVGLCAQSFEQYDAGKWRLTLEMRAAGIALGLGTDGRAGSNNDLDLMEKSIWRQNSPRSQKWTHGR